MVQGLIYSIISAICYGMMAVLAKLGYQTGLNDTELLQFRFTFAIVILLACILVRNPAILRIKGKTLAKCAFLGMVVYVVQSTCFFRALIYIPASTTALIFYLHPVTVTLLSMAVFRMRLTRAVGWSLFLVTSGCALVFYDAFLKSMDLVGLGYALGAMSVFSIYLVLVQVMFKGENPLTATFYVLLFTGLGFNLLGGPSAFHGLTGNQLLVGLALGLVPTAIAVSLLYLAIEKVGSAYACIFSTFEPVATLVAAHLVLGEPVDALQLFGVTFIIVGIIWPNARLLKLERLADKARKAG